MTSIETKTARGTKRKCQSEECGLNFYDLNRSEAVCPNCGTVYVPPAQIAPRTSRPAPMFSQRARYNPAPSPVLPDEEAAEVIADKEPVDDTLLEEDDSDEVLPLETDDGSEKPE